MGTLIALAAAGIAIAAYLLVSERDHEVQAAGQAATLGRLVDHTMGMDPLAGRRGPAAAALLASRARDLVATGRLVSVTVVDPDLHLLARETIPGLEEQEALERLGRDPFAEVQRRTTRRTEITEDTIYVLMPLADSGGESRGVLAIGVPLEVVGEVGRGMPLFVALTLALSVLLGLIVAAVLTGQLARPIQRLAQVADRLETGRFDTSSVTPLIGRRDEIGRLARVILRLVQALDHLGREMEKEAERRRGEQSLDAVPRD